VAALLKEHPSAGQAFCRLLVAPYLHYLTGGKGEWGVCEAAGGGMGPQAGPTWCQGCLNCCVPVCVDTGSTTRGCHGISSKLWKQDGGVCVWGG
jgi:hypothetical protein